METKLRKVQPCQLSKKKMFTFFARRPKETATLQYETEMSEEERKENAIKIEKYKKLIKHAFNYFDIDGKGSISSVEWRRCFDVLHHGLSPKQVETIMNELDSDGSGTISASEFEEGLLKIFAQASYFKLEERNEQ